MMSLVDHCRVVLSQLDQRPGSDYINASFVDVSDINIKCSDPLLILSILRVIKSQMLTLLHKAQSVTL